MTTRSCIKSAIVVCRVGYRTFLKLYVLKTMQSGNSSALLIVLYELLKVNNTERDGITRIYTVGMNPNE